MTKNDERINHPSHYTQGGIECIDALKAATVNKPPFEAVEDIDKAAWYLQRLHKEVLDKINKYEPIIENYQFIGVKTPWHAMMIPVEGSMFTPVPEYRVALMSALLQNGGFCPCQPTHDRDTMCPCLNYRKNGKCICGLFVEFPQEVVKNDDKDALKRDDGEPEKRA